MSDNTATDEYDEFDPANFDFTPRVLTWDDVGEDCMEVIVQRLLDETQEEDPHKWAWLKPSERTERARKLYNPKYSVRDEGDRMWMEEEFPGYTFNWETASSHHDHPLSHMMTELNEIEMTSSLVASGKRYIDLFGNGARDLKYKRNAVTAYGLFTPRDYLRYQNPTSNMVRYDLDKICDPNSWMGKIDDVCITHALYYLTMDQIGRIVNTTATRRLRALVHRHPESGGHLNRGELAYSVDRETLQVMQVNKHTGEYYSHPTLEALFHQFSARTEAGGVAWTVTKAGGDSYVITFVGCPREMCMPLMPARLLDKVSVRTEDSGVTVHTFLRWSWVTYKREGASVCLDDGDLLTKLRRYVTGKQRDPKLWTETMNLARRLTNKADIISIHGGGAHKAEPAMLVDYVASAFYMDVKHELETCISAVKSNETMIKSLNKFYGDGTLPTDLVLASRVAQKAAGVVKTVYDHYEERFLDQVQASENAVVATVDAVASIKKAVKKRRKDRHEKALADAAVLSFAEPALPPPPEELVPQVLVTPPLEHFVPEPPAQPSTSALLARGVREHYSRRFDSQGYFTVPSPRSATVTHLTMANVSGEFGT